MNIQKLYRYARQAIDDFDMIEENDNIAVGLSGGKDSITLLYALAGLKKFYTKSFQLYAITVDLGFPGFSNEYNQYICDSLEIELITVNTQIYDIVFNVRNEKNPCSLCAKMRKGALNDELVKRGINKVAYAHHKDDVIETYLLSLIYEGRFSTLEPMFNLEKTGITVIRPLIYVNEKDIKGFINKYSLNPMKKICPMDGNSKREYIKNMIKSLNHENPGVSDRIFNAILNSDLRGWNKNGE